MVSETLNTSNLKQKYSDLCVKLLVFQPTPFCNLNCTYCYLPDRKNKSRMSSKIPADTLSYLINAGIANNNMQVSWHAGEPLAAGIRFYQEAIRQMEDVLSNLQQKMNFPISTNYTISHSIQTNATLINDEWCLFFKEKHFSIGVSIDGPQFLNDKHRVFSTGKSSFDLTIRGINFLKHHEIPFHVISVISYESLDYPDEIYNFFESLGITYLGINVEEEEGINFSKIMRKENCLEKYHRFFTRLYERQQFGKVAIREVEYMRSAILNLDKTRTEMNTPFQIFSVDHLGNFSTFCPELIGIKHDKYGSFMLGNIYDTSIGDVISSERYTLMCKDIEEGIKACAKNCEYFFLCGGGAPGNKLYENGSFASTETFYCKTRIKIPVQVVLPNLEKDMSSMR
jgi:uncharacterized protein